MLVIVRDGRDHRRLTGLTGFDGHRHRICYGRRIARSGRSFLHVVRARGNIRYLFARNRRTVIRNREGYRDICAALLQRCRAAFVGVHGKRVFARKLALRNIGTDARPVFGHEFLDLEGAVARRVGDGVGVASIGGLFNSYRTAVVCSGSWITFIRDDIDVINLCLYDTVLNRYVHALVTRRKFAWHLERETGERTFPIVVIVQRQDFSRSIYPNVRAVWLLHFLANRVRPVFVTNLLLQFDGDRIAFVIPVPVCPHLLHLDIGTGIILGGHGVARMVDILAVIRCAIGGHLE